MTIMTGADLSCQPWRRRGLATRYIILTLFLEASSGAGREDIGLMGGGTSATSASSASSPGSSSTTSPPESSSNHDSDSDHIVDRYISDIIRTESVLARQGLVNVEHIYERNIAASALTVY